MKKFINDILNLFFPELCLICNENLIEGEHAICKKCLNDIPKTNYHLQHSNPVEKKFWGKADIFRGTSYYFFSKGSPFQKLLHELKYRNNQEIGEVLGKYAALDLLESEDFKTVDIIIPIPLHIRKLQKRGYNQSEVIAKGLSAIMNIPVNTTTLSREKDTLTQTKKAVFERYENTFDIFKLTNSENIMGKHVLLVDDVLTTGSTIEAAVHALQQCGNVKISIFTIAVA